MKNTWKLVAMIVLLGLASGTALAATPQVGDLLLEIAQLRGIRAQDAATAERGLRDSGVDLPALDLRAPLTQGAVVAITRSEGVHTTTSQPDATLDDVDMTRFLVSLAPDLGDTGASTGDNQAHGAEEQGGPCPPAERQRSRSPDQGQGQEEGPEPLTEQA